MGWVTLDDGQHVYIGSGGKVLATRAGISGASGGKDRGTALAARSKAAIGKATGKAKVTLQPTRAEFAKHHELDNRVRAIDRRQKEIAEKLAGTRLENGHKTWPSMSEKSQLHSESVALKREHTSVSKQLREHEAGVQKRIDQASSTAKPTAIVHANNAVPPSVKEQAAAARAGKGTREQRLETLKTKAREQITRRSGNEHLTESKRGPVEASGRAREHLVSLTKAQQSPATTRAIEHAKAAGPNSEQAKTAQALRVQRYARKTGNDFDKAKAERAESLKELKPLRAEQQKVMATDSERFAKRPYETKHYTEKLHEVTKPYGYEDTKGTLPSYYPSKAKAALMLAKSNIRDQARATEATIARAKEAKLSLGKQVTGLDRAGGVSVQSRYEMAGKEAMQSRGFKKQEITLANEAQTKVKADVKGDYAVHRVPYEIPKSQERTGETHQITHVPTGKALPGTFTPSRAKTMVASLVARKVDAPAMLASKPGRIKMNRLYSAMANRYKG